MGVPLQRPSLPQREALGDGRQLGAKRVEVLERLSYFLMSVLVKTRKVKLHRQLGWFGLALGIAIPIVAIATTIAMGRLRLHEGRIDTAQFLIIPFFDMVAFSVPFGLSMYWRKQPEFHRRLILIATCSLTAANDSYEASELCLARGRIVGFMWTSPPIREATYQNVPE